MTLLEFLNQKDRMAASNGICLTEIREGYAKAEMTVEERHLNGGDVCQGGALFTLADLAVAAVMNSHGLLTFGIENTIAYHNSGRLGDHLTAEATLTLNHHKLPYCEVKVWNQKGDLVASCTGLAYRKQAEFKFDALM
ncbi:MAG: PaaI family thioesterase [Bacteroidales bacterium]|nr:PaaI family thioesterase [Bacteroidales bacterium]